MAFLTLGVACKGAQNGGIDRKRREQSLNCGPVMLSGNPSAHPIKLTTCSNTTIMEVHIHRKQVWLAQKFVKSVQPHYDTIGEVPKNDERSDVESVGASAELAERVSILRARGVGWGQRTQFANNIIIWWTAQKIT